ncbi:MAG: RagB/SusD family nutrient uptake outer membrane protein [Bacteroidota bacterium]
MKIYLKLILLLAALGFMACGEDYLEATKPASNLTETEFTSNVTLDDLVRGAYFNLKSPGRHGVIDIPSYRDLSTDILEQKTYSQASVASGFWNVQPLYLRQTDINDIEAVEFPWAGAYQVIYNANTVLEFYANNPPIDDAFAGWVPRIQGESHFLRAFAHYQLATNYAPPYQSAPGAESVILQTESAAAPTDLGGLSTNEEVYTQIVNDLKQAIALLPEEFDINRDPEDYQDRAKRDAARFLLAKVYFLMGSSFWQSGLDGDGGALEQINAIIDGGNYPLFTGDDLNQIFRQNGLGQKVSETVWYAAYYFRNAWRTPTSQRYYSNFTGNQRQRAFAFSKATLAQIGWDDEATAQGDERYNDWFRRFEADGSGLEGADPTFGGEYEDDYNVWCAKFTNRTDNFIVFRSPELYLMRAVIRLADGDLEGATQDVNVTRERAGLTALTNATAEDIEQEWIKEYAFEGRRLFYLQATQQNVGPGDRLGLTEISYDDPSLVRALPRSELTRNPNL